MSKPTATIKQTRRNPYRGTDQELPGILGDVSFSFTRGEIILRLAFYADSASLAAGALPVDAGEFFRSGEGGMPGFDQLQADIAPHWDAIQRRLLDAVRATPRGGTLIPSGL